MRRDHRAARWILIRMRLRYLVLFLLPFTVLFVVAEYFLIRGMTAPTPAGCFDQCGMGDQIATALAVFVGIAWVVLVAVFTWAWWRLNR